MSVGRNLQEMENVVTKGAAPAEPMQTVAKEEVEDEEELVEVEDEEELEEGEEEVTEAKHEEEEEEEE